MESRRRLRDEPETAERIARRRHELQLQQEQIQRQQEQLQQLQEQIQRQQEQIRRQQEALDEEQRHLRETRLHAERGRDRANELPILARTGPHTDSTDIPSSTEAFEELEGGVDALPSPPALESASSGVLSSLPVSAIELDEDDGIVGYQNAVIDVDDDESPQRNRRASTNVNGAELAARSLNLDAARHAPTLPNGSTSLAGPRLLGDLLESTELRQRPLSQQAINLSLFVRNMHTQVVREAIARVYNFVVFELRTLDGNHPIDLHVLSHIRFRNDDVGPRQLLTNVLAGRMQLGKTDAIAGMLYVCAVCLGVVGIGLTRNAGGDETLTGLQRKLDSIAGRVSSYLQQNHPRLWSDRNVQSLVRPAVILVKDFWRGQVPQLGRRRQGMILLGRQNMPTLQNLFFKENSQFVTSVNNAGPNMDFGSHGLKRYALVLDEDDEATGSAGRDHNLTELSNHQRHTLLQPQPPDGLTPNGRRTTPTSNQRNNADRRESRTSSEDTDDDTRNDAANWTSRDVLATNTVRGQACMIVGVTATWWAMALVDASIDQPLNIVPLPLRTHYTGLFSAPTVEPGVHHVHIRTLDNNAEAASVRNPVERYQAPLQQIMGDILARRTAAPSSDAGGHHASLHINAPGTTQRRDAENLCGWLIDTYRQERLVVFAFNSMRDRRIYVSEALSRDMIQEYQSDYDNILDQVFLNPANQNSGLINLPTARKERHFSGGIVLTIDLPVKARLIKYCYDIAREIFEVTHAAHRQKPFVICVSGFMGGRGVTFKDSTHQLILTDQFLDISGAQHSHYERALQLAGRICSVDPPELHQMPRTLWITEAAHAQLLTALQFYEETMDIVQRQPGDLWTFHSICHQCRPEHRAIIDTIVKQRRISRPAVQTPVHHRMYEAFTESQGGRRYLEELEDEEALQNEVDSNESSSPGSVDNLVQDDDQCLQTQKVAVKLALNELCRSSQPVSWAQVRDYFLQRELTFCLSTENWVDHNLRERNVFYSERNLRDRGVLDDAVRAALGRTYRDSHGEIMEIAPGLYQLSV